MGAIVTDAELISEALAVGRVHHIPIGACADAGLMWDPEACEVVEIDEETRKERLRGFVFGLGARGRKRRSAPAKPLEQAPAKVSREEKARTRRREVHALVCEGHLQKDIAARLGIAESTVRHDVKALGLKPAIVRKAETVAGHRAKIKSLAKQGLTQIEIAKRVGISTTAVGAYLREGLPSMSEVLAQRRKQVAELREQGMNQSQIARHLGVSAQTVSNDVAKLREQIGEPT